jgi:EAL domain-containing protein (putative c-di-GMP-specific phosphodiesterase class I)
MCSIDDSRLVLEQLRSIGISVAIDDFGAGLSNLACLRNTPIDVLKIDRSFLQQAYRELKDEQILRAIIDLAQSLGLGVVAEGVELADQDELLRNAGCPMGQGNYYARPMPADQVLGT